MGKRDTSNEAPGTGAPSFGAHLRRLREAAGLSQEELAFRAGLSPNAVGALERGVRKRPQPHTVRSLADALGLAGQERAALLAAVPARAGGAQPDRRVAETYELPHPATPLVGRERELEEVSGLLARPEVRLLTLTGIGGVGKTRLALEAAREAAERFPAGAVVVALASLGNPALVLPSVVRALGLREADDRAPAEVLRAHLHDKTFLLVLDNLEHVIDAAPEVAGLVASCPNLAVLATSRAPLRVRGEREYPVGPLALPASTRLPRPGLAQGVLLSPSGRLFAERARDTSPAFEVTEANAPSVAAICWRLAGLPLAIELAAAKTRFLDPGALLARLDHALSTAWTRDLPERQRTMRATLDWSYDLLAEEERALFRRLSVFAGGHTLEAAEEVCASGAVGPGGILGSLGRLVEQSLVTTTPVTTGGLRYGMLEPVRQYALEKLEEVGDTEEARGRHAGHFVRLAETAKPELLGPGAAAWLDRLEQEHDNAREALRWAREIGEVETGLRLSGALCWFWWRRGYLNEGRRWVEGFISEDAEHGRPAPSLARAAALYGAGELAFGQGDLARATEVLEEGLDLYRELDDEAGVAVMLVEMGQVARARGEHDRAAALSEEGLALGRKLGERAVTAIALNTLGHLARGRDDPEGAVARYEESLALFREGGDNWGGAYALANLAVAAFEGGDLGRASTLGQESFALYEKLGDKAGIALALLNLGDFARAGGEEDRATELYNEALALHRELGNRRGVARALGRLSAIR